MVDQPLLLVPPSEGKEPGHGPGRAADAFGRSLGSERVRVREALRAELRHLDLERARRLLKVRGPLLDHAIASMQAIVEGTAPSMPAWRRYTGVVWGHLEPGSMSDAQRRLLLVPSALYGLTTGLDAIADYRLTMSVGLAGLGNLASFWREPLTSALCSVARGRVVVDLLPQEHAAAFDFERIAEEASVVHVGFVAHDGTRAVGHGAKAVKGVLARRIADTGLRRITTFEWSGWRARRVGPDLQIVAPAPS